jgi:hypothetical protein
MESQVINQEILLFKGSSFCSRKFCKRNNDDESNSDHSSIEELERACWDGMLYEMLPELLGNSVSRGSGCIWNTVSGVNYLCVNLGSSPMTTEKQNSIDPYVFSYGAGKTN